MLLSFEPQASRFIVLIVNSLWQAKTVLQYVRYMKQHLYFVMHRVGNWTAIHGLVVHISYHFTTLPLYRYSVINLFLTLNWIICYLISLNSTLTLIILLSVKDSAKQIKSAFKRSCDTFRIQTMAAIHFRHQCTNTVICWLAY